MVWKSEFENKFVDAYFIRWILLTILSGVKGHSLWQNTKQANYYFASSSFYNLIFALVSAPGDKWDSMNCCV